MVKKTASLHQTDRQRVVLASPIMVEHLPIIAFIEAAYQSLQPSTVMVESFKHQLQIHQPSLHFLL